MSKTDGSGTRRLDRWFRALATKVIEVSNIFFKSLALTLFQVLGDMETRMLWVS